MPAPTPTDTVLLLLLQSQLLDAEQLRDITHWVGVTKPDVTAVANELVKRSWLTAYQVREIYKGRGAALTIGPYVLLEVLGEGGMGRVYKARQTRLGRTVALKVIRKEKLSNPQVLNRFHQEIHAVSQLSHPNVVMAFDAETEGGNVFLSMEYVEGTDLTKLVQKFGPMPVPQACEAIRQAAFGLQHAHERGLVHRDIKPSNLLYTLRGQVKVLDLGLAMLNQRVDDQTQNSTRITHDGFVIGTPDFLAPEQAQDAGSVDIRADIYSLGATLFYLLTARVPYEGANATEKLIKHVTEPPPSLCAVNADLPTALDQLVQWFMAKRADDRPQTPTEVAKALLPFTSGSAPVSTTSSGLSVVVPGEFNDLKDMTTEAQTRSGLGVRAGKTKTGSSLPLIVIGVGVVTVLAVVSVVGAMVFLQSDPKPQAVNALGTTFEPVPSLILRKISAGSFVMGSPPGEEGRLQNEGPEHSVTISQDFYMSEREITREQYLTVTGTSAGAAPIGIGKAAPRLPATNVTWTEAAAFCTKLNARDANRQNGWEYRLPSEAEWEYAARAGGTQPFGERDTLQQFRDGIFKIEPGDGMGETNPDPALASYAFETMPCTVVSKNSDRDSIYRRKPNVFGLYDMSGNVWEWCADGFRDYSTAGNLTDPSGARELPSRGLRGGAYDSSVRDCRAARRREESPSLKAANIGFRIVFAPKKK